MTSQGKEDLKIFKMAPRAQLEFVGEGADVTGEGEDFQNFKMALRAFRIGATYCMFKVLWVRVGIWARLGKFSRFFIHFVLAPPVGCLRYFGHASPPRNLRTRAAIGAQARPQPIRGNSNRVFDYDF